MAVKPTDSNAMTAINSFAEEPTDADRRIAFDRGEGTTDPRPAGELSANLRKSEGSTRVVNYPRWRSKADFEARHQALCQAST